VIKVLVVDDHAMVRAGVTAVLTAASDISVVGQCSDGDEVFAAAASSGPDVVLMDVVMPAMSGIDATRELTDRQPAVRVLIFTALSTVSSVDQAFEAGAAGFLVKGDVDVEQLVGAVRTVAAGGTVRPAQPGTWRPAGR
jgi:DNA-binding NarL/FixJ family response regulator